MASAADQMAQSVSLSKFAKATDLKKRLWFTIGALIVFRMLSYVPLPGVDPTALGLLSQKTNGGVLDFFNTFSGGSLKRMSLIALGVMPYITASIVIQLATSLSPTLAAIKKEGESGRKKLNQYTRYGTVFLTAVQGYFIAVGLESWGAGQGALVVVSHDRYFVERVCDQVYAIATGGDIEHLPGGIEQYVEQRRAAEVAAAEAAAVAGGYGTSAKSARGPASHQEARQARKDILKIERQLAKVDVLERELQEQMATAATDHARLAELDAERVAAGADRERLEAEWLEASEDVE